MKTVPCSAFSVCRNIEDHHFFVIRKNGLIAVDQNFKTNITHIFAIENVIEGPQLAHRASEKGVALMEYLAGKSSHVNYLAIPNVIYTSPEFASLGFRRGGQRK